MARGRFYNVDPTPDNFRALWESIHRLSTDVLDAKATITTQQATIVSLQTSLTKVSQQAEAALGAASQQAAALASGSGSGGGTTSPPVDTIVIPDHLADVQAVWTARQPTVSTVEWAFKTVQTLAWQFRNEVIDGVPFAMGLLIKTAGDNIYTCGGVNYSAGRVCYPNGHIFKILTDVPTTNGPEWADDGFVDPQRYHVATDPAAAC